MGWFKKMIIFLNNEQTDKNQGKNKKIKNWE